MQNMSLFRQLSSCKTLTDKLRFLGERLQTRHPQVERFSIALYHPDTDIVRTFFSTSRAEEAITAYEYPLSQAESLREIAQSVQPRVIHDLNLLVPPIHQGKVNPHTLTLVEQGWLSSYTAPLISSGQLMGFVFFNSRTRYVFREEMYDDLEIYSQLIAQLIDQDQAMIRALIAASRSTMTLCAERDPETGGHLERMAHYTQLIASRLSGRWSFTDRQIRQMFLFAPLHDIGKVVVPDSILLKPGRLTEEEFEVMKNHTLEGARLLDLVIEHHGLDQMQDVQMLKNMVLYHHEKMDGSGYPFGLKGADIPIEARIVAVADVFDALTSERPYKPAWSMGKALHEIHRMAGTQLDADCVDALSRSFSVLEKIHKELRQKQDSVAA